MRPRNLAPASDFPTQDLLALKVKRLWRFFTRQDATYWAMVLYLIVEYVRPQQMLGLFYGLPLGQLLLGAALVAMLASGRPFRLQGNGGVLMLLMTLVIALSLTTAFNPQAGLRDWKLWANWVLVFFIIVSVVNTEQRLALFMIVWMLCHYYMSQGATKQFVGRGFTFTQWGVVGAPGWFQNSGEFGIAMCMLLAVSWHFYQAAKPHLGKWAKLFVLGMPITAVLSIVGSSSRGVLLGLGAWLLWEIVSSPKRFKALGAISVVSIALWFLVPAGFKDRFDTAGEDRTSEQRLYYWRNGMQIAMEHPLLGIGYRNWLPYYNRFYFNTQAEKGDLDANVQVAHNIFVECVAELGFVGLGVFVAMIFATLSLNYKTRKLARSGHDPPSEFLYRLARGLDGAMIGYLVGGFFVTVFYYPFFWINFGLTTALYAAARRRVAALRRHAVPVPRPIPVTAS